MKTSLTLFTMILVSIFISTPSNSQDFDLLGSSEDCILNKEVALEDLKNGQAKLYLVGGIYPKIVGNENEFEDEYGIFYHDFGCMPPVPHICLRDYNTQVFLFLDEQYGTDWRSKIRDDVIGVKDYMQPFRSIFK